MTKGLLFHIHSEREYMLPFSLESALSYAGRYTCHIGMLCHCKYWEVMFLELLMDLAVEANLLSCQEQVKSLG